MCQAQLQASITQVQFQPRLVRHGVSPTFLPVVTDYMAGGSRGKARVLGALLRGQKNAALPLWVLLTPRLSLQVGLCGMFTFGLGNSMLALQVALNCLNHNTSPIPCTFGFFQPQGLCQQRVLSCW